MPNLAGWLGDTHDLTKPKALETAKALRQRKSALDRAAAKLNAPLRRPRSSGLENRVDLDFGEVRRGGNYEDM